MSSSRSFPQRLLAGVAALAASTALAVGIASPAQGQEGRPLAVYQIPALGLHVNGLVVPGPYFASVVARTTGTPGEVNISAPADPTICYGSAASSHVTVNYLNLMTGKAGEVTVKPCATYLDPTPLNVTERTGGGQVAVSIRVTNSAMFPDAGQPSLPGAGTFRVP
ncbi:hypothetical protein BJF89_01825 [Corynebacterium sp. CNJ-954]|uniref:hypothetical protein n=1 Tax=Corynebacterium sp. CNJ-954 TaxID=1904962 RepID=UPI00095A9FEE|nr:hypothetical protein [Corynebacterium sp. CNJ-954]OLT54975.1 hypothetical protein BJF89_01825 [Corynebacterium sp. CNJ-954]